MFDPVQPTDPQYAGHARQKRQYRHEPAAGAREHVKVGEAVFARHVERVVRAVHGGLITCTAHHAFSTVCLLLFTTKAAASMGMTRNAWNVSSQPERQIVHS